MKDPTAVIDVVATHLKSQGFDPRATIAILGNIGKETGFELREENLDYRHTPNDRIRAIFGHDRTAMSDDELTALKQSPEAFAEHMYGCGCKIGQGLGNVHPGDGYKFRGRGYIQVTGRANYTKASQDLFGDARLADNPEALNEPSSAAMVCGWYLRQAAPGMARRMGIDTGSCSQADMNLLYTSAIAGQPIKRGVGYLGTEVIGKVDTWAEQMKEAVSV